MFIFLQWRYIFKLLIWMSTLTPAFARHFLLLSILSGWRTIPLRFLVLVSLSELNDPVISSSTPTSVLFLNVIVYFSIISVNTVQGICSCLLWRLHVQITSWSLMNWFASHTCDDIDTANSATSSGAFLCS